MITMMAKPVLGLLSMAQGKDSGTLLDGLLQSQIQRKKVNPPLLNFLAETKPLLVSWIPEIAGN